MELPIINSYIVQDGVVIPTKNEKPCPCPYATRVLVPMPRQVVSAPGTMDMTLNVGYCNSQCPLFQLHRSGIDEIVNGFYLCAGAYFKIDKKTTLIK